MAGKAILFLLALLALAPPGQADQDSRLSLAGWVQEGALDHGSWNLAQDLRSVHQSVNNDQSFFVGAENARGALHVSTIEIGSTSDDDMVGLVFGFRSPAVARGDAIDQFDTYVLDWKARSQTYNGHHAHEGFALYHIRGTVGGSFTHYANGQAIGDCFWSKNEQRCPAELTVLATDYGTGKGWRQNTAYQVELLYQEERVRVFVQGGAGTYRDGVVVFDLPGTFQDGRFGFYDFSQPNARFAKQDALAPRAAITGVSAQECTDGGAWVSLDGSPSTSRVGEPLSFQWSTQGVSLDDAASPTPTGWFPLGTTRVDLHVTDSTGTSTASTNVVVQDTQPPRVAISRPAQSKLYINDQAVEPTPPLPPAAQEFTVAVGPLTLVVDAEDDCWGTDTGRLAVQLRGHEGEFSTLGHYTRLLEPAAAAPMYELVQVSATDPSGRSQWVYTEFIHIGTGVPMPPDDLAGNPRDALVHQAIGRVNDVGALYYFLDRKYG